MKEKKIKTETVSKMEKNYLLGFLQIQMKASFIR